jgi:putative membrane protein insertion efficiency factor
MNAVGLALRGLIRAYQLLLSPLLAPACRFLPSCSAYALEAIEVHGPLRGSALAARRVCRCHPWGGSGFDPVPPALAFEAIPLPLKPIGAADPLRQPDRMS